MKITVERVWKIGERSLVNAATVKFDRDDHSPDAVAKIVSRLLRLLAPRRQRESASRK